MQRENGGKNTDALERRILKITMTTIKTLRYYDEVGLLKLSSVHESNGYCRVSAHWVQGLPFPLRLVQEDIFLLHLL